MGYWADREREPAELLSEYDALVDRFLPASGPADTAQGEALRCAVRLAAEYYGNGNINWGQHPSKYTGLVAYIDQTLASYGPPDLAEAARPALQAVRAIGLYEADESDFPFDPWDQLIHVVVQWCLAHQDPLPVGTPTL